MALVAAVLVAAVVASCGFWLAAARCARAVLAPRPPPHPAAALPPVSILKPVRGLDVEAWNNFVSHCEQRYPDYEVVFGVADPDDPAAPLIRLLERRYGTERVRLVIARHEAPNPKAGLLDELARRARHDVLVATDSDVRLPPDALARAVARLADPAVGLVTLPYRGGRVLGLPAALEALGITTAFLPSALVGLRVLRAPYAFGAANALRRDALDQIGGFRTVSAYLADDYQLGRRIGAAGLRVEVGDVVVETVLGRPPLGDWWCREVRWARTIRASRRAQYPGLLITFTTPLALAAGLAGGTWLPLLGSLAVRWHVGWRMARWTGDRALGRWLWLLPLRDAIAPAIWLAGLAGRRVRWRGRTFEVAADGRLAAPRRHGPIARAILALDRHLRRRHGIFEFTDDPACVLRLSVAPGPDGERIGALHLWNEQLPASTLALGGRLSRSFALLARFIAASAELADVREFAADLPLNAGYALARLDAVAWRYGVRATANEALGWWARWSHAMHVRLLRRAFLGRARGRGGALRRIRFSITRDELLARYLEPAPSPVASAGPELASAGG